ncbi:MAG: FAD/NAD(P)-binding protein [Gammaproteobacteria bacterium]
MQTHNQANTPLKIGIIGAGFSGAALAATFFRSANQPLEIYLFEKDPEFGLGEAYSTKFPFHWLNVRARDMSAFEDAPDHFVNWLKAQPDLSPYLSSDLPLPDQFISRLLYGKYVQDLIKQFEQADGLVKLIKITDEVLAIQPGQQGGVLKLKNGADVTVDKIILAFGNHAPTTFKFPIDSSVTAINDPWNYAAIQAIPKDDAVAIIGTGLSMIDATLLLHHQQHLGPIYAISRHGLLPLPHTDTHDQVPYVVPMQQLPTNIRQLAKWLRKEIRQHEKQGGDWRSVITAVRVHIPSIWKAASLTDRKRFLRHVLPYWNVHRHRVHPAIAELLANLSAKKQLKILAGRVIGTDHTGIIIQPRHDHRTQHLSVKWLINCMGPSLNIASVKQPLIVSILESKQAILDPLNLGFAVTTTGALQTENGPSTLLYTLGPPAKSATWECNAVPEIRKQIAELVSHII